MKMLRLRTATGVILAAVALTLGACGADDDEPAEVGSPEDTSAETTVDAPEEQAAELVDVRVGNFGHFGPTTLVLQHAAESGIFERNGINYIEEAPIYNASQIAQSVEQGAADLGVIGPTGAVALIDAGRPLKLIGNINVGYALHIVLTNEAYESLEAKGITADSSIAEKVEALRGMTIAAPAAGSASNTTLRFVLSEYGLDPDSDVLLQPFGDDASIIAAARQGSVDGIANIAGSGGTALVADGLAKELINFGEEDPVVSAMPVYSVVANTEFLEENEDAATAFLRSLQEARQEIEAGLDEATIARLKEKYVPDMDSDLYNAALEIALPAMTTGDIVPTEEQAEAVIGVYNSASEVPASITFEDLYRVDLARAALEQAGERS